MPSNGPIPSPKLRRLQLNANDNYGFVYHLHGMPSLQIQLISASIPLTRAGTNTIAVSEWPSADLNQSYDSCHLTTPLHQPRAAFLLSGPREAEAHPGLHHVNCHHLGGRGVLVQSGNQVGRGDVPLRQCKRAAGEPVQLEAACRVMGND